MDQSAAPSDRWDPAIRQILDRARRFTIDQIVILARRYADPPGGPGGVATASQHTLDRRRVLAIAKSRAARHAEISALESDVSAALHGVGSGEARRALLRLGILDAAERAVTDAALAILLRDRLGADAAAELGRPLADLP